MENISSHITYAEATKSQAAVRLGISNAPNTEQLRAMELVAEKCFEPLRAWHGKPIGLTSFFRSPEVNKSIGGASLSSHMLGEAMDLDADVFNNGITNADIFHWLRANVDFDQLIWEFGDKNAPDWVHVAYRASGNRKQLLRAVRNVQHGHMVTQYIPFIP